MNNNFTGLKPNMVKFDYILTLSGLRTIVPLAQGAVSLKRDRLKL